MQLRVTQELSETLSLSTCDLIEAIFEKLNPPEDAEVHFDLIRKALVPLLSRTDAASYLDRITDLISTALAARDPDSRLQQLYLPAGAGSLLAAGFVPAYATFTGEAKHDRRAYCSSAAPPASSL